MSKNKPLLSDEHLIATDDRVRRATLSNLDSLKMVRDHYEAQLSKDRELIQTLTNSIAFFLNHGPYVDKEMAMFYANGGKSLSAALALAGEQGHKPTPPP